MSTRCPKGHLSEAADSCDQCGTPLRAAPAAGTDGSGPSTDSYDVGVAGGPRWSDPSGPPDRPPEQAPRLVAAPARADGETCPVCQTARARGQRYCEQCAYDFVTDTPVGPPSIVPFPEDDDGTHRTSGPLSPPPGPGHQPPPGPRTPGSWVAELVPDRAYFDRGNDGSFTFPTGVGVRVVELTTARVLIGRRSPARGIFPEIDLSQQPEDEGVSRAHALLERTADGRITVTDLGSANGTWIGDGLRPTVRGVAVEIADGARIYVGSFTRITVRAR